MPEPICLQFDGNKQGLKPEPFISAMRDFLGLLKDLDATISNDPRGTIAWTIHSISKNSPALIALEGKARHQIDRTEEVKKVCIEGMRLLSEARRPQQYSDHAISKVRQIAGLYEKKFVGIKVFTGEHETELNYSTLSGIDQIVTTKYESTGSIVGNLDSISVHRGNEFKVWDETTKLAVTCRFPEDLMPTVKESLKHRVVVFGQINANYLGLPVSILVEGIESYPEDSVLPTIDEMSGLIDDLTEGLSLRDYMEKSRSG